MPREIGLQNWEPESREIEARIAESQGRLCAQGRSLGPLEKTRAVGMTPTARDP